MRSNKISQAASDAKTQRATLSGPLRLFFAQMGFGTAFVYLTSGVFLSGLALLMGAGDVLVSYLSVVVNICGVLILAFASWLERFRSRKRLAIALTALSRAATLAIVLVPVAVPQPLRLAVFVPLVLAAFALQAQTTVVLNQWMLGFVDAAKSGRYISARQTLALAVTVVLSVVSGAWMDAQQGRYVAFAVVFAAAAGLGVCEILLLARTPDTAPYASAVRACTLRQLVALPLRHRAFRGFVAYITLFYLLLTIADSFTMVYLMKYLALPYTTVNALYLIISLPQVVLLGVWGKLSDTRGHAFVLQSSLWLFVGEMLFLFFAAQSTWFVFVPLAFLVASVANAGFVVAVFNRRYELMPAENRIVYDNFYTAAIGLGCLVGPMLGGALKTVLEQLLGAGIRPLYLLSAAGILVLQVVHWRKEKQEGQHHAA